MRCAIERDWQKGTTCRNQTPFIDILLKRFVVADFYGVPASISADLGPVEQGDKVEDRPYRSAAGGLVCFAAVTRLDRVNAARDLARKPHDLCETHLREVVEVLVYVNSTRGYGLTFDSGGSVLSVYCYADYAKRETDR